MGCVTKVTKRLPCLCWDVGMDFTFSVLGVILISTGAMMHTIVYQVHIAFPASCSVVNIVRA